jgi:PIN domain nuclease of toxin-antitoxin system
MEGNPSLSAAAAALLADPANRLHLSMASVWEMAIKVGLKKMGLSVPYATFLATAVTGYGLTVLPITTDDCVRYEALPFLDPQHRDPFDRMIVTQALRHGLSIVGVDVALDAYRVPRLW